MIQREGKTCRWCGYPIAAKDEFLCGTCLEWNTGAGQSQAAITYAAREGEKARYERRKQWEKQR